MRIKNLSDKPRNLAGSVTIQPNATLELTGTAKRLVNSPLFKAYEANGILEIVKPAKAKKTDDDKAGKSKSDETAKDGN